MPAFTGAYRSAATYKRIPVMGSKFTIPKVIGWTPTLAIWGGSALGALLFFADSIPKFRAVLEKVPVIGPHYDDSIPAEDNAF